MPNGAGLHILRRSKRAVLFFSQRLISGSGITFRIISAGCLIFTIVAVFRFLRSAVGMAIPGIHLILSISAICGTFVIFVFIFIILCHLSIPPNAIYLVTLYILPKRQRNIHQNDIDFFSNLYYNQVCKKNLPFKNSFLHNPLFNYLYSPRNAR